MIATLKSRLRRARVALLAVAATLLTALIITPAHAAAGLEHLEGGTVAAVVVLGTLAFALSYEVWHLASRKTAASRQNAKHN